MTEDSRDSSTSHWAYEQYVYEYADGTFCEDRNEFIDPDFCGNVLSHSLVISVSLYAASNQ